MKIQELSDNVLSVRGGVELYGLEIEVEGCEIIPGLRGTTWRVEEDGSLRNYGREFVSIPYQYDEAVAGIDTFYGWFKELHYQTSIRTSTHIHVSVLDFTTEELATMLTVYCVLEPLLFRVCGREREENIYCVPWYRGTDDSGYIRDMVNKQEAARNLIATCKYSALYLEPVMRFGTVEFRHAPVFDDAESMLFWLDLVRCIVYNGKNFSSGEAVMQFIDEKGIDEFVRAILDEDVNIRLRTHCDKSYEDIIDEADSLFSAEACVPSLYTYKVTNQWTTGPSAATTIETTGYHRSIDQHLLRGNQSAVRWGEENPVDEDEYFEEEDEY